MPLRAICTTPFHIKQNSTAPKLTATLKDGDTPIDLTTADHVQLKMLKRNTNISDTGVGTTERHEDELTVDATVNIVDAANGEVEYEWAEGDVEEAGVYDVEFEIVWDGGGVETVPESGYVMVVVQLELAED